MEFFDGLKRRDFIKLSSVALGGIVLTGCGNGGGGRVATIFPNGYSFYRVKNLDDQLSLQNDSFQISGFLGSAYISSNGIITFDAEDSNKRRGIFQLGVDYSGNKPNIEWERSALLTGEHLVDERVVGSWSNFDVDEAGNIAAIIDGDPVKSSDVHYGGGLYHEESGAGFNPLLIAGQEFNDGQKKSSGIFYCVSIKNNQMIASLNHLPAGENRSTHKDSLLHIPNGTLASAKMLLSRGDYLGGSNFQVKSFGLLDHNDNGDYTATVFAAAPALQATQDAMSNELRGSFNFSAHVDSPNDHLMVTASPDSGINGALSLGTAGYAPRISPNAETYALLLADDQIALVKDDQLLLSTGDTIAGVKILHIGTGSVGTDGLYYYSARTEGADSTLFVFDGVAHTPLISSGDILSDGGAPVARIIFGTTKRHVDGENRLIFCCSFTDGSTSLVVGLPS